MQTLLNGLDGLLGMHGSRTGDDDGLQCRLILEQFIITEIRPERSKFGLSSVQLGLHWRADGYQIGLGSQSREVPCMSESFVTTTVSMDSSCLVIAGGVLLPMRPKPATATFNFVADIANDALC